MSKILSMCYFCGEPASLEDATLFKKAVDTQTLPEELELRLNVQLEDCLVCSAKTKDKFVIHAATTKQPVENMKPIGKNAEGQDIYLHPYYVGFEEDVLEDAINAIRKDTTAPEDLYDTIRQRKRLLLPLEVVIEIADAIQADKEAVQ